MSQYTVITDGYGSFGSVNLVITDGYSIGEDVAYPLTIGLMESLEYLVRITDSTEF